MILVGSSGVGKTAIATRKCKGEFCQNNNPTVGVQTFHTSIRYSERTVPLTIWDGGGQDAFKGVIPIFLRESDAVIVVGDMLTECECIERLDFWAGEVRHLAEGKDIPIIVAINKTDLSCEASMTVDDLQNELSSKYDHLFFVSAKTGAYVDELFGCAIQQMLERKQ